MKQEEIRKCTKVVELFRSMMDELGDMCVVYGMPKAIYEAGVVDEVVPLDEVAQTITKNVGVK